jgi:hypothetical protein
MLEAKPAVEKIKEDTKNKIIKPYYLNVEKKIYFEKITILNVKKMNT